MAAHRTTRGRRGSAAAAACLVLVVVAALGLTACSGDDEGGSTSTSTVSTQEEGSGEGEPATRDDVVAAITETQGMQLNEEELGCVGDGLTEALGADRALEVINPAIEVEDAEITAAGEVFGRCVSAQSYSASVLSALSGEGGTSEALGTCLTESIDGQVGEIFAEGRQSGVPTVLVEAVEGCVTPEDEVAILASQFTRSGMDAAVSECVAAAVAEDFGVGDLLGGSQELQGAIGEAMADCGSSGSATTTG